MPDLVVAGRGPSLGFQLAWFPNAGAGVFLEQRNIEVAGLTGGDFDTHLLLAADLTLNGAFDLVLQLTDAKVVWLENNGNGNFTTKITPLGVTVAGCQQIAVARIDADMYPDLFCFQGKQHTRPFTVVDDLLCSCYTDRQESLVAQP